MLTDLPVLITSLQILIVHGCDYNVSNHRKIHIKPLSVLESTPFAYVNLNLFKTIMRGEHRASFAAIMKAIKSDKAHDLYTSGGVAQIRRREC